jgi:hypothetical protein
MTTVSFSEKTPHHATLLHAFLLFTCCRYKHMSDYILVAPDHFNIILQSMARTQVISFLRIFRLNAACILQPHMYCMINLLHRTCKRKLLFVTIGCPTRYRTRHFFNNSNTNEDIATKFEQKYVLFFHISYTMRLSPLQVSLQYPH